MGFILQSISPTVNVLARLEFELAYDYSIVKGFNHDTPKNKQTLEQKKNHSNNYHSQRSRNNLKESGKETGKALQLVYSK